MNDFLLIAKKSGKLYSQGKRGMPGDREALADASLDPLTGLLNQRAFKECA